ncbi:hypothetical protein BC940DRAFT_239025 [Gongronella butleri]|nr:hypothetical protein BC940DRAFT_239025 [Gongronella butleri]
MLDNDYEEFHLHLDDTNDTNRTLELLQRFNNSNIGPERLFRSKAYATKQDGRPANKKSVVHHNAAGNPIVPGCYRDLRGSAGLTMYWIPKENEWDITDEGMRILLDKNPHSTMVDLKSPDGKVLATVSQPFYQKCRMEGTCLLANGDLINLSSDEADTFYVIGRKDRTANFFGWGSGKQNLVPYVSVAVNDLPLGQTLYIPELDGANLGNGLAHNGCVRVDDDGWSFGGCQLDLFVISYVDHLYLDLELGGEDMIHPVIRECTPMNYVNAEHLRYVHANAAPETIPKVMVDKMTPLA